MYLNIKKEYAFGLYLRSGHPTNFRIQVTSGDPVGFRVPCDACCGPTRQILDLSEDLEKAQMLAEVYNVIIRVGTFYCRKCRKIVYHIVPQPVSVACKVKIHHVLDLADPPTLDTFVYDIDGNCLPKPIRQYFSIPARSLRNLLKNGLELPAEFFLIRTDPREFTRVGKITVINP